MFARIILAATCAVSIAGCATAPAPAPTPLAAVSPAWSHADPSDDCAPGPVVIRWDETPTCDLVGGVNTLSIVIDGAPQWGDAWGGDGSLAWAQTVLEDAGCSNITWTAGTSGPSGQGFACDY